MNKSIIIIYCFLIFIFSHEARSDDKIDLSISNKANCFSQIERDKYFGDSIIVSMTDSTTLRGVKPMILSNSSILYLKNNEYFGGGSNISIPFNKVDSFTYYRESRSSGLIRLLGFGIGCAIGAAINPTKFESDGFNLKYICRMMVFGFGGGVIGAVIGDEIGKKMTVKITVDCF